MAHQHLTQRPDETEQAVIVLCCLLDDAYRTLNPRGERYASLKRLSDSEVLALALFQQLQGVESDQSFLHETERFFAHLFSPAWWGCGRPHSTTTCASSDAS